MNLSNTIAQMILDMLAQQDQIEIQRNELAQKMGCVPSQINYVIASRFTPEHGYLVESRRGGGGYIRITRASTDRGIVFMHLVNSIGAQMNETACRAHIFNLHGQQLLSGETAQMMLAAVSENCYRGLPAGQRDAVRAAVFKQMLLAC